MGFAAEGSCFLIEAPYVCCNVFNDGFSFLGQADESVIYFNFDGLFFFSN